MRGIRSGACQKLWKGRLQRDSGDSSGHCLTLGKDGVSEHAYWKLESRPHTDSFEKTVEKTAWLVEDAVKKQMLSDIPISTFLSGGVDSSLVTSICARELKNRGKS